MDVSPDQIEAARRHVPDVEYVVTDIQSFNPGRTYDLVLAVEVLMHVPPWEISTVTFSLLSLTSRHLVTVDWTGDGRLSQHNWRHDYSDLPSTTHREPIGKTGQTLFHVDLAA